MLQYWFITPQEGQTIRFTQNSNAFYMTTLYPPNSTLILDSPVPYVAGDKVTVVGGNMSGTVIPSQLLSNGSLQLSVSQAVQKADQYAWVFKISFGGVSNGMNGSTYTPGTPASQTTSAAQRTLVASSFGGALVILCAVLMAL